MASKQAGMVPITNKHPPHDGSLRRNKHNQKIGKKIHCLTINWRCFNLNKTKGKSHSKLTPAPGSALSRCKWCKIEFSYLRILSTSIETTNKKKKHRAETQTLAYIEARFQSPLASHSQKCCTSSNMTSTTNRMNEGTYTNQRSAHDAFWELLSSPKRKKLIWEQRNRHMMKSSPDESTSRFSSLLTILNTTSQTIQI